MKRLSLASLGFAMLAGCGLMLANRPAAAEGAPVEPETTQEITIVAPFVVQQKVVGRSSTTGAPIVIMSVSRRVSFADLDLGKASDATALRKRITDAAKAACDQLDQVQPSRTLPSVRANRACVKTAIADAMPLADAVIAAAAG
jgi:UrcA family protein